MHTTNVNIDNIVIWQKLSKSLDKGDGVIATVPPNSTSVTTVQHEKLLSSMQHTTEILAIHYLGLPGATYSYLGLPLGLPGVPGGTSHKGKPGRPLLGDTWGYLGLPEATSDNGKTRPPTTWGYLRLPLTTGQGKVPQPNGCHWWYLPTATTQTHFVLKSMICIEDSDRNT